MLAILLDVLRPLPGPLTVAVVASRCQRTGGWTIEQAVDTATSEPFTHALTPPELAQLEGRLMHAELLRADDAQRGATV